MHAAKRVNQIRLQLYRKVEEKWNLANRCREEHSWNMRGHGKKRKKEVTGKS